MSVEKLNFDWIESPVIYDKQLKYRKVLEGWEAYLQTKPNWSPLMLEVIEDQRASSLQLLLAAQLEEFDFKNEPAYAFMEEFSCE